MSISIVVHKNKKELAFTVAKKFLQKAVDAANLQRNFYVSLSGGNTPKALFKQLADAPFAGAIPWANIHLFWGDERCVPPNHPESNFGMTKAMLLDHIDIPAQNIHRIHGEATPVLEAKRYAAHLRNVLPVNAHRAPVFDWVFLGMGNDGHTASLFPGTDFWRIRNKICTAAEHPVTGQQRISLTLPVINAALEVTFLVTGAAKAEILAEIVGKTGRYRKYPAAKVQPLSGKISWQIDAAAAAQLSGD